MSEKPITTSTNASEELLKCLKSQLQEVHFMTKSELFDGFDTIKAITFSYDIGFIDSIMKQFQYGEIILGANFLVQKDAKLTNFMKEVFTNAYEASQLIRSYDHLAQMMKNGDVCFRTPLFLLDHRKIYILRSDDGRTRVIKASANMAHNAWNGSHMEFYEYDDSADCYEEYSRDFETAWINSEEIPYQVVSSKKSDDLIEGNPIIKKTKETDCAVILQTPRDDIMSYENIKYVIDHEKIGEQYQELLNSISLKPKKGVIEIVPKTVEKIIHNANKLKQKYKVKKVTESYPLLTFDFASRSAMINGQDLDLNPPREEVTRDIDELLGIFHNFEEFIGDIRGLQSNHYKLLNAVFVSPFNARFRCALKIRGKEGLQCLPLYLLIASDNKDAGKSFMIRAILKMMTGCDLPVQKKDEISKQEIRNVQVACKGIPVFIDELDTKSFGYMKDIIKNPELCENNQIETQPMILFASNDILEPDAILRKRMVFLRFQATLPSSVDADAYKGRGDAIIKRLGTALYREYLRRMLDITAKELEYIMLSDSIPDTYYPDLIKMSSNIMIDILSDYGYAILEYVRAFTWNDDYSVNASYISENTLKEIERLYRQNRSVFSAKGDTVIIQMGNDSDSKKMCKSWGNTLPPEMMAKCAGTKDGYRLTIDRYELEQRLGHKIKGFAFFQRR